MNGREYKYYSGDCKECHGYDMVHDVADNWLDTLKYVNERRRNSSKPPIFPSNVDLYIYGTKTDFNIEEYTQEYIKEEMLNSQQKCDATQCEKIATRIMNSSTTEWCANWFLGYYCDEHFALQEAAMKEETERHTKEEKISGRELAEKYKMNPMPEENANTSKFVASLRFRGGL